MHLQLNIGGSNFLNEHLSGGKHLILLQQVSNAL